MTTAVLVPPSDAAAVSTVATTSSSPTKNVLAVVGNKNTLDEGPESGDEQVTRVVSTVDAAATDNNNNENNNAENANTANISNNASSNKSVAASATRAAGFNPLKRCHSTPAPPSKLVTKKRRRVSFESADIVEFEPTVFTTTVTSGGIPVGMSLTERSRSRRRLDSWELEREDHRVGRQNYMEEGYLDPTEREQILNSAGCAEHSMLSVEAEVNQIIAHRRESNEVDFDFLYGLVAIGEEESAEDEEEEDDDDEEDEEEDDVEEVQLLSSVGGDDVVER